MGAVSLGGDRRSLTEISPTGQLQLRSAGWGPRALTANGKVYSLDTTLTSCKTGASKELLLRSCYLDQDSKMCGDTYARGDTFPYEYTHPQKIASKCL